MGKLIENHTFYNNVTDNRFFMVIELEKGHRPLMLGLKLRQKHIADVFQNTIEMYDSLENISGRVGFGHIEALKLAFDEGNE
ncbi:MAG: Unknown protein [uncultured Sulfurovum sp.]|uniref:Uncharacterized protein n=1 Tax=uncultured Sulfurovum sp. TaxID=269237 RepID=A0A6S6U563_9BACT|nr:MAG: Unknown protein [uncultured Sulfurovum sp.]